MRIFPSSTSSTQIRERAHCVLLFRDNKKLTFSMSGNLVSQEKAFWWMTSHWSRHYYLTSLLQVMLWRRCWSIIALSPYYKSCSKGDVEACPGIIALSPYYESCCEGDCEAYPGITALCTYYALCCEGDGEAYQGIIALSPYYVSCCEGYG